MHLTENAPLTAVVVVVIAWATWQWWRAAFAGVKARQPARVAVATVLTANFVIYFLDLFDLITDSSAAQWRRGFAPVLWLSIGATAYVGRKHWRKEKSYLEFDAQIARHRIADDAETALRVIRDEGDTEGP